MINDTVKPFGDGGYAFSCVTQDDSFYYAVGGVNNYEPKWSNMLIKIDKNFTVIQKIKYIDTAWYYADYPYNTIFVNNTQILTCPQTYNDTSTYGKIIAIDKTTLNTLWTKMIEHPDTLIALQPDKKQFSDLTAIKQTPDGGYILTGNYNKDCITANLRSFLLKIDSIGNVEWRRTYNTYYTFFDIEIAADSGYFVPSSLNGTNAMQLVKFKKNGVFEWSTRVMYNPMAGYPLDLTIYNNHYAIISSNYVYDSPNFYMGVNISKVDLNTKSVVWEKSFIIYQTVKCVGLHQAMGVETLADGSIIVNGTVVKIGTDYSAFILKLNSNGDSLWTKTYRFKNSNLSQNQLNDLMICDDGGFLGVGFYKPQAGYPMSAWLFKTDANGTIGFEKTVAELVEAKVYPNPANDFVTVDYKIVDNFSALELIIRDVSGREVLKQNLRGGSNQELINISSLSNGTYLIVIKGDGLIISSSKLTKVEK